MNNIVFNKTYSISVLWALKKPIRFMFKWGLSFFVFEVIVIFFLAKKVDFTSKLSIFIGLSVIGWIVLTVIFLIIFIFQYLVRKNFNFRIEEDFIIFNQGIIKKQQKNLPYGVIQNVVITQDILDRIFDIYNLIIENAASLGVSYLEDVTNFSIGFYENVVIIPGLEKNFLYELNRVIQNKIKTKSFENTSGL